MPTHALSDKSVSLGMASPFHLTSKKGDITEDVYEHINIIHADERHI